MSSVVISGDTSGTVSIAAPAIAGSNTLTLLAATATNSVNTLGTAVATTSGTSIDFTGLPSWIKRIIIMLQGVSTNSSAGLRIQIGAGSVQTSAYLGAATTTPAGSATSGNNFSSGFDVTPGAQSAASVHDGIITLVALNSSNIWMMSSSIGREDAVAAAYGAGKVTASGTLDRVRITTTNGTDTFDAGSVNILYEG